MNRLPTAPDEQLSHDWFQRNGWQRSSEGELCLWSKLLQPLDDGAAEIEIICQFDCDDSFDVSLHQGLPDQPNGHEDHVLITTTEFRTVQQLERLLSALVGAIDGGEQR